MKSFRAQIFESRLLASGAYFTPCILLLAAVLLAYINSIGNQFLFDDQLLIVDNDYLKSWSTLDKLLTGSTISGIHIAGGFYRPLQMLLYFLIYQATGPAPFGFHLLNIALHAANACLLFTLGRKLNFNTGASFLAALIWALHPIHTEAITYISGTADPLYAFFCLSGLLILFPDFTPRQFLYATPLMILGLFSKETTVVFPLLAMSCLYYFSAQRFNPKTYLPILPLFVIALVYVYWRSTAQGFDGPQSYGKLYQLHEYDTLSMYAAHPFMRFYTFLATLPEYLSLILWPHDLHMERDFDVFVGPYSWMIAAGFALCVTSITTIIHAEKKLKPLGWGLLWFGAAHFPDTGLLVPMNAIFLEHWMYLPTAGLFLGLAQTIYLYLDTPGLKKLRKPVATAAMALSIVFAILTCIQNRTWRNEVTFYSYLLKFGVGTARIHNNLANSYMANGDYEKAIEEFHRALELGDTYAEIHFNLALALLNLPDQPSHIQEAIDHFNRATEIDPNFYRSYDKLAAIYAFYGDTDKSTYYKEKAEVARKNAVR